MKALGVLLVLGIAVASFPAPRAIALPVFRKSFETKYAKAKGASAEFKAAVKKAGCNVCHIRKQSKKKRNEYGMALSQLLKKEDFKVSILKKDPKGTARKINEAFEKVEKMKNKAGKTFGELLKANSLPGS